MLSMYKQVLVEYAELRGRAATQLCMDAAALIEDGGVPQIIYGQRCSILPRHLPTNARQFLTCVISPSRTGS